MNYLVRMVVAHSKLLDFQLGNSQKDLQSSAKVQKAIFAVSSPEDGWLLSNRIYVNHRFVSFTYTLDVMVKSLRLHVKYYPKFSYLSHSISSYPHHIHLDLVLTWLDFMFQTRLNFDMTGGLHYITWIDWFVSGNLDME